MHWRKGYIHLNFDYLIYKQSNKCSNNKHLTHHSKSLQILCIHLCPWEYLGQSLSLANRVASESIWKEKNNQQFSNNCSICLSVYLVVYPVVHKIPNWEQKLIFQINPLKCLEQTKYLVPVVQTAIKVYNLGLNYKQGVTFITSEELSCRQLNKVLQWKFAPVALTWVLHAQIVSACKTPFTFCFIWKGKPWVYQLGPWLTSYILW